MYKRVETILANEPEARIIAPGDYNEISSQVARRAKGRKKKQLLHLNGVTGSRLSFFRKGTKPSAIDHMLVSASAKKLLAKGTVLRTWRTECDRPSDHAPLEAKVRLPKLTLDETWTLVGTSTKPELVRTHQHALVFHNRWSSLSVEDITTQEELDDAAVDFSETVEKAGLELGFVAKRSRRQYKLNRVLAKQVKKVQAARKAWRTAVDKFASDADELHLVYQAALKAKKAAVGKNERKKRTANVRKAVDMCHKNDMKSFWRWEKEMTSGTEPSIMVTPIRHANGSLLTSESEILGRTTEYYKALAQDDPRKLSQDKEYWAGKCKRPRRQTAFEVNFPPTWEEALKAMRKMTPGTAPGGLANHQIHPDVFKALLREECNEKVRRDRGGVPLGDTINVPLPEKDLPTNPLTPMGCALNRVLQGIWKVKSQPKKWDTSVYVSIFKSGDPTELVNYRGISLIEIAMKIFTSIMADRITNCMNYPEGTIREQGGFVPGEEAIAQFIALAETVRRRRLAKLSTFGIFVDFKKAFDKVHHEALFAKLENEGFRGDFLEVIKGIYESSKACAKVGDNFGDLFDLLVGTRQGCPLSPILFLIFINDIFNYLPAGVGVPGVKNEDKCPGLLFADDLLGLADSLEKTREVLAGVAAWSKEWEMPVGANKCGVMVWSDDEQLVEETSKELFEIGKDTIEYVKEYKYLGIVVSPTLGDSNATDEKAHGKTLAMKIQAATFAKKSFLRDSTIPILVRLTSWRTKVLAVGCYGAEWIGLSQERTDVIQKAANIGLRLILHSSSKSTWSGITALCMEFGIPTIEEKFSDLRIRLWRKAAHLRGWLRVLSDYENKPSFSEVGLSKTWVTGTAARYSTLINTARWGGKRAQWQLVRDREVGYLEKSGKPICWKSYNSQIEGKDKDEGIRQYAALLTRVRRVCKEAGHDPTLKGDSRPYTKNYYNFNFAATRNFLKAAMDYDDLTEGTQWLVRLRTSNWWSTANRVESLKERAKKPGPLINVDELDDSRCPCCNDDFRKVYPEWVHILLECPEWEKQRRGFLGRHLSFLRREARSGGTLTPLLADLEIAVRLLGGSFVSDEEWMGDIMFPRREVGAVVEVNACSLDLWQKCWGAETDLFLPGSYSLSLKTEQGWVAVAKFLQTVMPKHRCALEAKLATPRTQSGNESSGVDSPMKARGRNDELWVSQFGSILQGNISSDEYDTSALEDYQEHYGSGNVTALLPSKSEVVASHVKALWSRTNHAPYGRRLRVDESDVWY
jgi:hypothetical protein